MSDESYTLLVAFPDDSASFVNGFEAGQLWSRMQTHEQLIEQVVHADNAEVIQRMAASAGYIATLSATAVDGWSDLSAVPGAPQPTLRLVSG